MTGVRNASSRDAPNSRARMVLLVSDMAEAGSSPHVKLRFVGTRRHCCRGLLADPGKSRQINRSACCSGDSRSRNAAQISGARLVGREEERPQGRPDSCPSKSQSAGYEPAGLRQVVTAAPRRPRSRTQSHVSDVPAQVGLHCSAAPCGRFSAAVAQAAAYAREDSALPAAASRQSAHRIQPDIRTRGHCRGSLLVMKLLSWTRCSHCIVAANGDHETAASAAALASSRSCSARRSHRRSRGCGAEV